MKTEFVVAVAALVKDVAIDIIYDVLVAAMDEQTIGFEPEEVASAALSVTHKCVDASGGLICGLFVDLPDDIENADQILDNFTIALVNTDDIRHVARFEDDALRDELRIRADQIYAVEMKTRRALTFAYLRAPVGDKPYEFLRDDHEKPHADMHMETMRKHGENSLFHLGFKQYARLNTRKKLDLDALNNALRTSESFEMFRAELSRSPLNYDEDQLLVAGLQQSVDALEKVRNSVAHNRRLSSTLISNLNGALSSAHAHLDEYLRQLQISFYIEDDEGETSQ